MNWTKRGHLCILLPDYLFPRYLSICGDVESNPGPLTELLRSKRGKSDSKTCRECNKIVRSNQNGVFCDGCRRPFHFKCTGLSSPTTNIWTCFNCGLPQLSDSFFDSSHDNASSSSIRESVDSLQNFGVNYLRNLKIGYININSLGGTKFIEISKILRENILDVLVIGETKLNYSFSDNQFHLSGYKLFR